MQGLLAVAERATHDDEPLIDETVHERRMISPPVLLTNRSLGVPVVSVHERDGEVHHRPTVAAGTDAVRERTIRPTRRSTYGTPSLRGVRRCFPA